MMPVGKALDEADAATGGLAGKKVKALRAGAVDLVRGQCLWPVDLSGAARQPCSTWAAQML